MNGILLPGIIAIGLILYLVSVYNSFVTTKTRIEAAIQEIGNQLKRQANLIPNLESSAKGYLKHEKEIFSLITSARKAVDVAAGDKTGKGLDGVESTLGNLTGRMSILVESNPELKGNTLLQDMMNELRDTADKLMYARRSVIDLTQQYNQMLVVFPTNIIANIFGFTKLAGLSTPTSGAHLEVSMDETKDTKVTF